MEFPSDYKGRVFQAGLSTKINHSNNRPPIYDEEKIKMLQDA